MKIRKRDSAAFCVKKLKVLADQARLSVLEILMSGPKRVFEINDILKIEQSLLSHHLKVLRDEGFVETSRDGKSIVYRIAKDAVALVSDKSLNLGCCVLSFDSKKTRPFK